MSVNLTGAGAGLSNAVVAHGDYLLRLAYQLTHNRHTAEDLVQDALLSVFRTLKRSPDIKIRNDRAYFATAVIRAHADRYRLKMNSELPWDTSQFAPSSGSAPTDQVDDLDLIWRTLAELPSIQRMVLVMRYYLDLPDSTIAQTLDCPEATIRSHARRALDRLHRKAHPEHVTPELPPTKGSRHA